MAQTKGPDNEMEEAKTAQETRIADPSVFSTLDWRLIILFASFACAASIFYRKQFTRSTSTHVSAFLLLGVLVARIEPTVTHHAIISALWAVSVYFASDVIKMDVFLWNFVYALSMTAVMKNGIETGGFEIVAFAVPQFTRKPAWLKTKLQYIRALFGPFYTASQVLRLAQLGRMSQQPQVLMCAQCIATTCALIAAVFFRPDNATMSRLIGYHGSRQRAHGALMTLSFVVFLLGVGLKHFV